MEQGSRVANNGTESAKSASQNTTAGMSFMYDSIVRQLAIASMIKR